MKIEKVENNLLALFNERIKARVPHWIETPDGPRIKTPTPLADITHDILECARTQYDLSLSDQDVQVFGKLDSKIDGGSVKVRPAVHIIEEAIASGRLRQGQLVFEATSGNFGLALGMLQELGFTVIALVSRKLEKGVTDELVKQGVKTVNLDVDICPAPGLELDQNLLTAKVTSMNVREQLSEMGLDTTTFDKSRAEIEHLLARQDVIGLAKLLAKVYDGYCPEQYDNDKNILSHETITGPEIDQQLQTLNHRFNEFVFVSTFGTGGTSTGIGNYVLKNYGKKIVRIVFPLPNQDVAGIRTKEKSIGLRFYRPEIYAGQHEVDYEAAKTLHAFFAEKGYDIGESSALALYAVIQMINYGTGKKFVVMIADGIGKYSGLLEKTQIEVPRYEVTMEEARQSSENYGAVLWTHGALSPKHEGINLIASTLNVKPEKVKVVSTGDVQAMLSGQRIPESVKQLIPKNKNILLVCMVGATSFRIAELLSEQGVHALSVAGGITNLPGASQRSPMELVEVSRE